MISELCNAVDLVVETYLVYFNIMILVSSLIDKESLSRREENAEFSRC